MSTIKDQFKLDFSNQEAINAIPPGILPESAVNVQVTGGGGPGGDCTCFEDLQPTPVDGDIIVYSSGEWQTQKQSIIGVKQGFTTTVKLTIGPNPPSNPNVYDLWLATNG